MPPSVSERTAAAMTAGGGSVGDEQHVCVKSVLAAGIEAVEQIEVHGEAYRAAALAKLASRLSYRPPESTAEGTPGT